MNPEFMSADDALHCMFDVCGPSRYIMDADVLASLLFSRPAANGRHSSGIMDDSAERAGDWGCDAVADCSACLSETDRLAIIDKIAGSGLVEVKAVHCQYLRIWNVNDPAKRCIHVRQIAQTDDDPVSFGVSWYVKPDGAGMLVCPADSYANALPYELTAAGSWSGSWTVDPGTCSIKEMTNVVCIGLWDAWGGPRAGSVTVRNATALTPERGLVREICFASADAKMAPWFVARQICDAIVEYEGGETHGLK